MNERNTTGSKNISVLRDEALTNVVGGWGQGHGHGGGMHRQGGGGTHRQGGGSGGMQRQGGGGGRQGRGTTIVFIFVNNGVINNGTIEGNVLNQ